MPALRLLHVTQPTTAGVARCVADLALSQQAAGVEVAVACPQDGWLGDELRAAAVPVHPWAARRGPGPGTAAELARLRSVLRGMRPDVVHLHSSKAGLVGRLVLRDRVPTAFSPHAWSFDATAGPVRTATLAWERAAVRWTRLLVCVSEAERRHGEDCGISVPRTVVVANGVDLVRLPMADAAERLAARAALGLDPGRPLAVCPGRLARQKGQDVLLTAWPGVLAAVPDAELALVGGGPDEALLRTGALPQVRFTGESREVGSWLAAADVVVVPSRWEGMALVPLEAMARGRSVVATDVTGMRESLPDSAGALVPAEDPGALAHAVAARLGGDIDADAEGRAGRAHVERAHDLRRSTAEITAACRALVGTAGRRR